MTCSSEWSPRACCLQAGPVLAAGAVPAAPLGTCCAAPCALQLPTRPPWPPPRAPCRALSLCPTAHPKDAEALVARTCEAHAIQPNATTARTLEKIYAVHEQLYG